MKQMLAVLRQDDEQLPEMELLIVERDGTRVELVLDDGVILTCDRDELIHALVDDSEAMAA